MGIGIRYNIRRCWNNLTRPFRKLSNGIGNLITWLPIIFNDKQWDYSYLFIIILKKLELMEDFYNSDIPISADAKIYASDINKARLALKYIADDKYNEDAFEEYYKKHSEDYSDMSIEAMLEKIVCSANNRTDEEREEFRNCLKKEEELYNEHMDIFCDTFKNRVRYWWD